MHNMPDSNSPSMTMNVRRLCFSARASTRSSGMLISSAPISWWSFHIFPVEMPSATRIATVPDVARAGLALDAGGARGGVGAHITQRVDSVETLDPPNRLPVDRVFGLGAVLGFELLPGPALERIG